MCLCPASWAVGSYAAMAPVEVAGTTAAPLSKAEVPLASVWSLHDTTRGASAFWSWHADTTRIFVQSRQGNPILTYLFLRVGTLSVRYADGGSQVFEREKDQR